MTSTDPAAPTRVSILARLIPAFSYALPALGAALSALLFIGVARAMRNAEAAGIGAIAGGMSEANLVIVVTLYLAVFVGLIGVVVGFVRCLSQTTTASPAGWFFLIGVLGFAPVLALWQAESLFIEVLISRSGPGVVAVADQINICLTLALGTAALGVLVLLVASVIPLPAVLRAKRKWAPVVFLVLMELALIVMTVAYHMRTSWFYQVMRNERF
jgi:hypothetical protein